MNNFWKNRKVFLTGHTGFKGAWLSIWLNMLGAKVTGYALKPPTNPSLFDIAKVSEISKSIIADIRDVDSLNKAIKKCRPEIVIHMAAQPIVRESYKIPIETYETNVMGTATLLEASRHVDSIRAIVNVTTDKVYENKERNKGYVEDEPLGGYDPYSSSKACSEILTSAYRRSYGLNVATARAGNVIGGGDWASDRLIPDFMRAVLKKEKIIIRNPRSTRPWQFVLEPLSGYLILAQKLYQSPGKYAQAWNFGPDGSDIKKVEWIVKEICSKWGSGASYEIDKNKHPHEAGYLRLDCSKAKKILGWKPKLKVENAIDKIVEWMIDYKNEADMRSVCIKQIDEYSKNIK